jgi:hypothetical protein
MEVGSDGRRSRKDCAGHNLRCTRQFSMLGPPTTSLAALALALLMQATLLAPALVGVPAPRARCPLSTRRRAGRWGAGAPGRRGTQAPGRRLWRGAWRGSPPGSSPAGFVRQACAPLGPAPPQPSRPAGGGGGSPVRVQAVGARASPTLPTAVRWRSVRTVPPCLRAPLRSRRRPWPSWTPPAPGTKWGSLTQKTSPSQPSPRTATGPALSRRASGRAGAVGGWAGVGGSVISSRADHPPNGVQRKAMRAASRAFVRRPAARAASAPAPAAARPARRPPRLATTAGRRSPPRVLSPRDPFSASPLPRPRPHVWFWHQFDATGCTGGQPN